MSVIELGDKVRDIVTGYEGVAIGVSSWLTGCDQIAVQSGTIKDGVLSSATWFDRHRLQVVMKRAVTLPQAAKQADVGGPMLMH